MSDMKTCAQFKILGSMITADKRAFNEALKPVGMMRNSLSGGKPASIQMIASLPRK